MVLPWCWHGSFMVLPSCACGDSVVLCHENNSRGISQHKSKTNEPTREKLNTTVLTREERQRLAALLHREFSVTSKEHTNGNEHELELL